MRMVHLSLGGLRVFAEAECVLGPGLNWFVGANGAGKTSVLEAVSLLAMGRSFRLENLEAVLRQGAESWWVRGRVRSHDADSERVLAVGRTGRGSLDRRLDADSSARASDLASLLPVLVFEPSSPDVVFGGSERRRRLLDWGVFHVEQVPVDVWGRYQRALRQRNLALRGQDLGSASAWEGPLAEAGVEITAHRQRFLERWQQALDRTLAGFGGQLTAVECRFLAGWSQDSADFSEALVSGRRRDLGLAYTYAGPHRADLAFRVSGREAREVLSRGQARGLVLALLVSLAECFRECLGEPPVLLLDDVCAELDAAHSSALFASLDAGGYQALVSSVKVPAQREAQRDSVFHVEQGAITPLLYSGA